MLRTPSQKDSSHVATEVHLLTEIVPNWISKCKVETPILKADLQPKPVVSFNLGCHGQSMLVDPPESHLLLDGVDSFSIKDLAKLRLNHSQLAYLFRLSLLLEIRIPVEDYPLDRISNKYNPQNHLQLSGQLTRVEEVLP